MGAKVYTYKGFIHSKVLISDNYITSIGSANMDRRSFSLNFEINTFIYDKKFNEENREDLVCAYAREYEYTIVDDKPVLKALELIEIDLAGAC